MEKAISTETPLSFWLLEGDQSREQLVIHNKHSRKIQREITKDHKYFEQRITWNLSNRIVIDEPVMDDEYDGKRELIQEIPYDFVESLEKFGPASEVKSVLDAGKCFSFDYTPDDDDVIIFIGDFRYKSISQVHRSERTVTLMVFRYQVNEWVYQTDFPFNGLETINRGLVVIE